MNNFLLFKKLLGIYIFNVSRFSTIFANEVTSILLHNFTENIMPWRVNLDQINTLKDHALGFKTNSLQNLSRSFYYYSTIASSQTHQPPSPHSFTMSHTYHSQSEVYLMSCRGFIQHLGAKSKISYSSTIDGPSLFSVK